MDADAAPEAMPSPIPSPTRQLAAGLGLTAVALSAAVWLLVTARRDAAAGPTFPADYGARFAALDEHLPDDGPLVEVFDGYEVPFVGYWSYPELVNPTFRQAVLDPELRRRIDAQSFHYNLTVQAMAPRIVVLPGNPIFQHVKLIVGNFESGEDVQPPGPDLELVVAPGNGTALWRRP